MLARIQAACVLALATVAINQGAASSNALSESGLTKLCNIATELQNAAGVANDRLQKIATAAEVAEKVEQKLLIAVLVADNNSTTIVFSAVAREAQRCKATTLAAIKTAIQAAVANVATTAMGAGVITDLADMLQKMTDNANNRKCISSSPGTTSAKLGDPTKLGCPPYAITEPPGNREFNSDKLKATGFTEFSAAQNSLVHTTDNNCGLLRSSASSVEDNWGNAATRLIGDLIAIQGHSGNAATANVAQADNIGKNFKVTGEANTIEKNMMAAAGAIHLLQRPACPDTEEQLLDHVLNPENLKTHLTTALKGLKMQTKCKEEQQITALINKVAGNDSDKATQLKAKLSKTNGTILENDNPILKPLSQLGGDEGLADALLHAVSEVKTPKTSDTSCPESNIKTNPAAVNSQIKDCANRHDQVLRESCKNITECSNKNCVIGKDYKPSQLERTKNGETNFTGSNSFVINKVPLLLACLLLE